ncbi:MAG TPA: serine/threonine-protein kinase [Polyangiaceae bacterium]|nr:serine/threonine-protein kinase [Polyangiaceae bacterium]
MHLTPTTSGGPVQGPVAKKYHPILEIGSGGMSRVYLTVVRGPAGFNKFQVVKRLLPSLASDPEFLNMFLEEARLSARLNHTNVVQINEVGFDGEHHFMAMEYLEGQSLESVVRRAARQAGRMPLSHYVRVLVDAAAGLHYAHEFADIDGRPLNIVHRDISPHNIFVTYQGQVKVLDFGIAKAADSSLHTRTGMLKGKVAYMAPEQLRQNKELDRRADIFALGVMLWQAAAGRRLWQDMSDLEVFQQLNTRQIPSLRQAAPDAPEALVAICERALAFEPDDRYASAAEFGDALEAYLAESGQRVSSRELGAYVSDLFAAKRVEVQSLIEMALGRRHESGQMPALPTSRRAGSDSGPNSSPFGGDFDATPDGLPGAPFGADPAHWTLPAPPRSPSLDGGVAGDGAPGRGRRLVPAIVLTLGASAVAFAIVTRTLSHRTDPLSGVPLANPGAVPSAVAPPPPDGAPAAPQYTRLTVMATPQNARLLIDEVPLSANPGSANFVRDGLPHRVRAEAQGFVSDTKIVVYEGEEQIVSFQLQRERKAAISTWRPNGAKPHVPAPPVAAPHPTPDAPAKPTATGKPNGPPVIDRDSPWPP